MKSENKFENINSNYFLLKVFDFLKRKKLLEIVKINQNLQKRLNININDYKDLYFSPIEIELNFVENKYGKFIRIPRKEKEYFHIYFNNSNEEINRGYLKFNEKVEKIKIIIDYQVKSFKSLFAESENVNSIFFKQFKRINISDMSNMFFSCSSLKELNISNFNTNKVTNMKCMFYGCSSLEKLNTSNFDTNNVINMSGMFYGCSSLEKLNLSNFNTNNVTNMSYMFYKCSSLNELNVSNFNTHNVTNMT